MRSAGNKNNIIQEVSDIFFKPKHIVARCHHDTCKKNNVSWNQLYFAKTGEKYNTKDKRQTLMEKLNHLIYLKFKITEMIL